jgi:hypothetical protein
MRLEAGLAVGSFRWLGIRLPARCAGPHEPPQLPGSAAASRPALPGGSAALRYARCLSKKKTIRRRASAADGSW